jgi:hypothetical protein
MRDPYELLTVPRSATADDIKSSFRRLAKELHPDANKYDPKAAARFAELNAAHKILGDKDMRKAFDRGEIDAEGRPTRQVTAPARRSTWNMVTNLMMVMLVAAVTLFMRGSTPAEKIKATSGRIANVWSQLVADAEQASSAQTEEQDAKALSEPRLILEPNVFYTVDGAVPLGIQVSGEAIGLALQISSLPTGMSISSGHAMGKGWRILATDLGNARIRAPAVFSGPILLAVELRLANDAIVDRGLVRFEWLRSPTVARVPIESTNNIGGADTTASKVIATPVLTDQNAIDHAGQSLVELLIGRSQQLISEGDAEAARSLLQPVAEAHDARAALALAETYDPFMLAILHAHGVTADMHLALDWYKKASEFGSTTARQRSNLLTSALTTIESRRGVVASDNARRNIMLTPPAKLKRRVVRVPTRLFWGPEDRYEIYIARYGVGAYPKMLMLPAAPPAYLP